MELNCRNVGIIGGGNMAKAIVHNFLANDVRSKTELYVSTSRATSLQYWQSLGVNATLDNSLIFSHCPTVILAIKPQVYQQEFENFRSYYRNNTIVSIMAGVPLKIFNAHFGLDCVKVVRVMPNLALKVAEGAIGMCFSKTCFAFKDELKSLFSCCGKCYELPESQMDAFSALAGSGPAFIFTIIDALSDGGVKMGLPRQLATEIATQMTFGSAKMLIQAPETHPSVLKNQVCSPAGTSIYGVHVLEQGSVRGLMIRAVEETAKRNQELSNEFNSNQ